MIKIHKTSQKPSLQKNKFTLVLNLIMKGIKNEKVEKLLLYILLMVIILFVTGCDNGNKPNYSDYDIADDSIMIYVNVKPETGEAEC